jgi:hypothetical protein
MSSDPHPSLNEFLDWPSEKVTPLIQDRTVVFSPGGSSRWYFLEYGEFSAGYDSAEQFADYSLKGLHRTVEIADLMFQDGLRTLFVVGVMPDQRMRSARYSANLGQSLRMIAGEEARQLYADHQIGVMFRGAWKQVFEQLEIADMYETCKRLELQTTAENDRWMIWLSEEEPLPPGVAPFLVERLQESGQVPDRAELSQAYYGRPLRHVDIFISHNKPTLHSQLPALLTVGDLYYMAVPNYYLNKTHWRSILYDHLFARRGSHRDYSEYDAEAVAELRDYIDRSQQVILGVGDFHEPTSTWRPRFSPPE